MNYNPANALTFAKTLTPLCRAGLLVFLSILPMDLAQADYWIWPKVSTNRSDNGVFEFVVTPRSHEPARPCTARLRQQTGNAWSNLWERELVNRVAPLATMIADSGRFVVTFSEWHAYDKHAVVIYGQDGKLIADLGLADLKLDGHPNIRGTFSSGAKWSEFSIPLFGPPAKNGTEGWRGRLEDSLFIRLYWGEVIAIDLATGRMRDPAWWGTLPAKDASELKQATNEYLEAAWHRLARDYFRKEYFFESSPTGRGVQGILLVGQLRLKEGLPLLREIAATDRFEHWDAPPWKTERRNNLRQLARTAIFEIESVRPEEQSTTARQAP